MFNTFSLQETQPRVGAGNRSSGPQSPPPFGSTFSSLVWPNRPSDFMKNIWLKQSFFQCGGEDRLREIAEFIPCEGLDELVALSVPNPIQVFFATAEGVHEQFSAGSVEEALRHYDEGKTLYFHIEHSSSHVRTWMQRICHEMGIPEVPYRVSIFATRRAGGILPHFDANENFTIQLVGSKRWQFASNEHLTNPTVNYFASEAVYEDMRPYVHRTLPSEMPVEHETAHLTPSSVLYLPGGFWHATNATDQVSISLNIVFPRITWADVFVPFARHMLLADSRWRERADDLLRGGERMEAARSRFELLTHDLAGDIKHFADFYFPYVNGPSVPRTNGCDTNLADPSASRRYRRNLLISWTVVEYEPKQDSSVIQFQPPLGPPVPVTVADVVKHVCEWAGKDRRPFDVQQLVDELSDYSESELKTALTQLVDIGFLQKEK